jgi:hypothetical protein
MLSTQHQAQGPSSPVRSGAFIFFPLLHFLKDMALWGSASLAAKHAPNFRFFSNSAESHGQPRCS